MTQNCTITPQSHRLRGFSLIEMSIAMVLFVVMGIAIANLLTTTNLTQINNNVHAQCEFVASSIVDRLRWDLRFAQSAQVNPAGDTLTITQPNVAGALTYQFAGGTLTRTDQANRVVNFGVDYYNDPNHPLRIFCTNVCFSQTALGGATAAQIALNNLIVRDNAAVGTALDNATNFVQNGQDFSRTQFRVQEATFNILAGQQFQ
jgi:prepilin-type N-terminal cleavage/methylation domain-containing protein